jgi:hypothetical protein
MSAAAQTPARPTGDGQAQGKADQAKEQAQAKAGEVKEQAQERARGMAEQARGRAAEQLDQRSTQAGEQVSTVASDVRSVGEELRKQGKDGPARIADQAAERAEKVGGYLQESDAERIFRDIEDFGRRQPWAVAAAGLALGFAASRFLKASSEQRYRSSSGGDDGGSRQLGPGAAAGEPYGTPVV